jgi:hypothetical protein
MRHQFLSLLSATPSDHLAGILRQRNPGPQALGSRFFTPQDLASLTAAAWEPYWHQEVAPGCQAWRAPIPGFVGVMSLDELPPSSKLRLVDGHATGFVETVYDAPAGVLPPVEFTTAIVGVHEGVEMVFTIFPGLPVRPSSLPAAEHLGRVVTLDEARALGFRYAKLAA